MRPSVGLMLIAEHCKTAWMIEVFHTSNFWVLTKMKKPKKVKPESAPKCKHPNLRSFTFSTGENIVSCPEMLPVKYGKGPSE